MAQNWFSLFVDWLGTTVFSLVQAYGLVGLFVASVIANATLFFPVPINFVVFGLGALAAQNQWGPGYLLLVGLASGLGAAIGELTGYFAGFLGGKALHDFSKNIKKKKLEEIKFKIHKYGSLVVFAGALVPFPFDIIGLAAGLSRFDLKKFFLATAAGKVLRDILIASAGYYGLELVRTIFL
jgi:membrane protein DedA with SNARE-associated domain